MCRSPRNRGCRKVMAVEGGASRGGGGGGGADQNGSGKKRYHRHTTDQIQLLEATFNECQHPDEKLRKELSQEMGLTPRQIKFWFQNRRTQMKAKSEMADVSLLRAENDKLRSESIAIKEALKNATCSTCGGPQCAQGDNCHEEQRRLRYENAQLKEELARVSSIVSTYIGRPLTSQFLPANVEQSHLSLPKLSMATYGGATQERVITMASGGPSLDLDLFTTTGIRVAASETLCPSHPLHLTGMHKSRIVDMANSALAELMRLFQTDEPFWTKSAADGRDVLDIDHYQRMFPRRNMSPNLWIEASRATADVMINSMQLVEMYIDSTKWGDLFPTIVLKARTIEVISSGSFRNPSGSLQLMYEELQVASPLVPIRQFIFIRFCQQIDQTTWAVVDFSYDDPQDDDLPHSDQFNSRRLPSGCLIQGMPNGYSKVTWIEHVEIEDKIAVHRIYRDIIYSGLAFGAERWLACLQRSCEKIVHQMMMPNSVICELGGVIPSDEGRKSLMKLAQRMLKNFCARIIPSCDDHLWSCVSDFDNFEVHATLYKSADSDSVHPDTKVLGAAATVWLPHSPQFVFDFLRDEKNRSKWDVLADNNPVQEVTHIANGAHPANCISVLRVQDTRTILILQESYTTTDSSESLVVNCAVDLPAMNIAMSGEEPVSVPLMLPSGFVITTDGRHSSTISTSASGGGAGSLVTVVAQIMVSGLPGGILGPQSVATVNNLIGSRVREIKRAMNCSSSAST